MQLVMDLTMKDNTEAVKKVEKKVKKAKKVLTFEEAWTKIFNSKLTDLDRKRLTEVFKAMKDGIIGREEGKEGTSLTKAEAFRLYKVLQEKTRHEKLEKLVKKTPDKYILLTIPVDLHRVADILRKEPIISVDTETTGTNVYRDRICGASFTAPNADLHWYMPFRHETGEAQMDESVALRFLAEVMLMPNDKVLHNANFDLHMFYNDGIEVNGKVHCTLTIMKLLNENEPSFKLKDLAPKYLGVEADTFSELFGENAYFPKIELKYARYYAIYDTDLTMQLFKFQMNTLNHPSLAGVKRIYEEIEQPIIMKNFYMERVGLMLDMDENKRQEEQHTKEIEELEVRLKAIFGDINFNSPAQLMKKLYDEMQLHKLMPASFKLSTDKKALKALAKKSEEVALLLEYRALQKHMSSFVTKLPNHIEADGKLHGQFNPMGTDTGRWSAREPNLQQQSPLARKMFLAPEGSVLISADFKAQESRLLAHYTQDPKLMEIYFNDEDYYAKLASEFYNCDWREVYKNLDGSDTKERKEFKVVALAITYGMIAKTLAESLGITEMEAQAILDSFDKGFPLAHEWIEGNKAHARKYGYVETFMGRKRRLPKAQSRDRWDVMRAERQATNARIQGAAADQTKLVLIAMDDMFQEWRKNGREFYVIMPVHDELLFQAPEDVTQAEINEIKRVMTETVELTVPSGTDIEVGHCWGDMVSEKEWFERNQELCISA